MRGVHLFDRSLVWGFFRRFHGVCHQCVICLTIAGLAHDFHNGTTKGMAGLSLLSFLCCGDRKLGQEPEICLMRFCHQGDEFQCYFLKREKRTSHLTLHDKKDD